MRQSVLIVESRSIVRRGISILLERSGLAVMEAASARQALDAVEIHPNLIVITELHLHGQSGFELLSQLKRRKQPSSVVVLTGETNEATLLRCLGLNVAALVSISDPTECLVDAIQAAAGGQSTYLSPALSHLKELEDLSPRDGLKIEIERDPLSVHQITKREREIFFLLVDGKTNKQIAKQLFISPRTVETHRARIVRKLSVKTNAELIHFAITNDLYQPQ